MSPARFAIHGLGTLMVGLSTLCFAAALIAWPNVLIAEDELNPAALTSLSCGACTGAACNAKTPPDCSTASAYCNPPSSCSDCSCAKATATKCGCIK